MKIRALIKPKTKHRDEVVIQADGSYVVYTTAPAAEGRANAAATQLLALHFGVAKTKVNLLRGAKSKQKVFEIDL